MCLENRLAGKAKEKAIAKLPETFRVWKYCPRKGPEYRNTAEDKALGDFKGPVEPRLTAKRWHKARVFSYRRSSLPYKPGFHAFLDYEKANDVGLGIVREFGALREFEARRVDVQQIGKFSSVYQNLKGVVLSHIKPI